MNQQRVFEVDINETVHIICILASFSYRVIFDDLFDISR